MSTQSIPHLVVFGKTSEATGSFGLDATRVALSADAGHSDHGGHLPTAVGTLEPQDGGDHADPFARDPNAIRARYLLEYGCYVVARLRCVEITMADHLDAELTRLGATMRTMLASGDQTLLLRLMKHLDEVLAPGELRLREVGL